MSTYDDLFILSTDLGWDGSGDLVDQLKGKSFGVNGYAVGDYIAESVTAKYTGDGDNGIIHDADSPALQGSVAVGAGNALGEASGKLESVIGVKKYTVTLKDGTVYTQDDFEGNELPVRILDSDTGYKVLIDFSDYWLENALNGKSPITTISFPSDATANSNWGAIGTTYFDDAYTPICFASGTVISTPDGERRVETLRPGDLVMTRDNGPQPLRWIGSRLISRNALQANPKIRPIRIRAGALGPGVPVSDLVVSPQHRILVQSRIVQRMFDVTTVLTAAKHLLDLPGVEVADDLTEVTYLHIMFDRHEVVRADGAWAESLYLGQQARNSLTAGQLQEIEAIFPGLLEGETPQRPAHMFTRGATIRRLVQRSVKNGRCLFEADA